MESQEKRILEALRAGDKLTPLDALERFGCFRLGARIHDLRRKGWPIESEIVKRGGKRVAVYWLLKGRLF